MDVAAKFHAGRNVVCAGDVIDAEQCVAALTGADVGEGVIDAIGLHLSHAAFAEIIRHKYTVVVAVLDGDVAELVVMAPAHENTQVIAGEDGGINDVVTKISVERNAGAIGVIMQIKLGEGGIAGHKASEAVEFIIEGIQMADDEPAGIERGDEATGPAMGGRDIFHEGITHVLDGDAVIADPRTFALNLPGFALLMAAIAVDEEVANAQVADAFGIVDGLPHDDDRTIGIVRQEQHGLIARATQRLAWTAEHDGPGYIDFASG